MRESAPNSNTAIVTKASVPNVMTREQCHQLFLTEYMGKLPSLSHPAYAEFVAATGKTHVMDLWKELVDARYNESCDLLEAVTKCLKLVKENKLCAQEKEDRVKEITVFLSKLDEFRLAYQAYYNVSVMEQCDDTYNSTCIDIAAKGLTLLTHLPFFSSVKRFMMAS